jgi:hypothetical protein
MNRELIAGGLASESIRLGVLVKLYGEAVVARAIGGVKLKPEFIGRFEKFLTANRNKHGRVSAVVTVDANNKARFRTIAAHKSRVDTVAKARSVRWGGHKNPPSIAQLTGAAAA